MSRLLLPVAVLLTLAGYFGPWVDHRAAGLVITGLDLGEFVKFLPPVRSGEVWLWRPGFYAPLVAASAACSLAAYRRAYAYPVWLRLGLLAAAAVAATNLAPPAWTPARLLEPEFRVQTAALAILLIGFAISPVLASLSERLWRAIVLLLTAAAILFPAHGYFAALPAISDLYGYALRPGWGLWLTLAGLVLLAVATWPAPSAANSDDSLAKGATRHANRRDE